ncbi:MAG: UDP-N-acetylmuramoyl-L-alanine--D-glutamate ligase [bacterium]|nr:UDP-N-acetylmuramoyl-L-alanine--D-glutamate ligase [bacterium]
MHGDIFKGKKVLVFGLGVLGGGVATTNWLLKHGARVTTTDIKDKKALAESLRQINGRVQLSLGGHTKRDIDAHDIVVVNPDVSINNPFIRYAFSKHKIVLNEALIFNSLFSGELVGVTGTRGKTTTVHWTNYFLNGARTAIIAGNSPQHQFLKVLDTSRSIDVAVTELSSFHLELFDRSHRAPDVAVITNVYQDHLNRHGSLKNYAETKARIFLGQTASQHAILNYDNPWTKHFISMRPRGHQWFFSRIKSLPKSLNGIWLKKDTVYFQKDEAIKKLFILGDFIKEKGMHNVENFLASALAAFCAGCPWDIIKKRIQTLPSVMFRQETIFKNNRMTIINDTTATSPEGGIAAVNRFGAPHCILITGGTDRQLSFTKWAQSVQKHIAPKNMVFLTGSATKKMREKLPASYRAMPVYDTLDECVKVALVKAGLYKKSVVLFSPSSKSFEKFKNEFDRGEQFNKIIRRLCGNQKK